MMYVRLRTKRGVDWSISSFRLRFTTSYLILEQILRPRILPLSLIILISGIFVSNRLLI